MRLFPTLLAILATWAWLMFHLLLVVAVIVSLRSKGRR